MEELGGEKIDVVNYSDDPAAYISAALSPATVLGVEILDPDLHSCRVTVPDHQLSLAIGNKGQNAVLPPGSPAGRSISAPKADFTVKIPSPVRNNRL